jgi:hypothetical protein
MSTVTTPQPGTEAFGQLLQREAKIIKVDIDGLKEIARIRAESGGYRDNVDRLARYAAEYTIVCNSEAGQATARDVAAYNQRAAQHNEALKRTRQAAANKRTAAKVQKASCSSCFTVHAGKCY